MSNTLKLGNGQWATGKDTLLGYNSENNNIKPLPFSFSRDSSATVVNKDGLIETVGSGKPRIDFKDNTKGALLLEPERRNIVLTSASGTYGNNPASETNIISPDGTNNAVIPTPNGNSDRYQYTISGGTYSTNTKLAYSWYRKRISTPIDVSKIGDLLLASIQNATQVGSTTKIESDVNGFDRFQAIFNITDGSATSIIRGYFGSVLGIGNSSVAYWGHQVEQGSYATSYIPTSGSAVTRVADSCSNGANDQVINSTEGVLYYEATYIDGSDYNSITVSNSSGSEKSRTWYDDTNLIFASYVNNVNQTFIAYPIFKNINYKIAIRYKLNDFALYVNGNKATNIVVNLGGVSPQNSYNKLSFNSGDIYSKFFGNIKDLKLYNTALTDQELIALTTI